MAGFVLKSDIAEISRRIGGIAKEFDSKTILLSGGCGFLGRYFVEVLSYLNEHVLDKPCHLLVADNLIIPGSAKNWMRSTRHCTFMKHNVVKPFRYGKRIDYIIHLAGIASPYYYRIYPLETLEVATLGTKNMLELARQKRAKLLYFSSSEIYGDPAPQYVPTPESYRGNVSCHGPRACYDESKRLGETLCSIYHAKLGTVSTIVRPFNVYGPGMKETDYRVLPNFASRIKAGLPLKIYGSGRQTRTFCYVTDALTGFLKALVLGLPGEAYNIGSMKPEISMADLAKRVQKLLGQLIKHNLVEYPDSYPADEPNRRCPDLTKARLQLEYEPQVSLDDGLRRFFDWALESYSGTTPS